MTTKPASTMASVQREPATGISVFIVGAGVGGIMTALECWRHGHEVHILERATGPESEGDYFSIGPASTRVIEHWPELKLDHDREACDPYVSYHKANGECVIEPGPFLVSATDGADEDVTHAPRLHRHLRAKFQEILLNQLRKIGISVQYDQRVIQYHENETKGYVTLDDGTNIEADVVVAADGLGTHSYELILGEKVRARSSGYAVFRTAYDVKFGIADSDVDKRFRILDNGHPVSELWNGPNLHLSIMRTKDHFTWTLTHEDRGDSAESWHGTHQSCQPADAIKVLDEALGSCPDILRKLFNTTPKTELVDWKIMWRDAHPLWTSPLGRVVQVGDAAHTFVPSSGNGANQAIEDATSLATCLKIGGRSSIPLAVRVHNKLRFERVACAQLNGFVNQVNRHTVDWEKVGKNPEMLKSKFGRWLWDHDAERYATDKYEQALEHLTTGSKFQNTNIPPGYVYKPWNLDELLALQASGKPLVTDGDWN